MILMDLMYNRWSFRYLYASYGIGQLNEILGATGDLLVVADVLQPQLDSSEELRLFIQNQYDNAMIYELD